MQTVAVYLESHQMQLRRVGHARLLSAWHQQEGPSIAQKQYRQRPAVTGAVVDELAKDLPSWMTQPLLEWMVGPHRWMDGRTVRTLNLWLE